MGTHNIVQPVETSNDQELHVNQELRVVKCSCGRFLGKIDGSVEFAPCPSCGTQTVIRSRKKRSKIQSV